MKNSLLSFTSLIYMLTLYKLFAALKDDVKPICRLAGQFLLLFFKLLTFATMLFLEQSSLGFQRPARAVLLHDTDD